MDLLKYDLGPRSCKNMPRKTSTFVCLFSIVLNGLLLLKGKFGLG
uniref:Uncharacterized protein n=1 Tax=Anguilla anguilla TaxID=7936 RepID=A0A0E9V4W9_ANGAN